MLKTPANVVLGSQQILTVPSNKDGAVLAARGGRVETVTSAALPVERGVSAHRGGRVRTEAGLSIRVSMFRWP